MSKFIWNFEIYCGKSGPTYGTLEKVRGSDDANLVEGVVLKILEGMENKGHVVVMDNYFTSVPGLFKKFLRGIYAMCIVRNNHVGLPCALCNTKEFHKIIQKTLDWCTHDTRSLSCMVWKDKRPILLLSIHSKPIVSEGEVVPKCPIEEW